MRSLVWALIQSHWWPYKKRTFGHTKRQRVHLHRGTTVYNHPEAAREWSSTSQEETSQEKPNLLTLGRLSATITVRKCISGDFPGGPAIKNPPSNTGDGGSIPGWGTKIPTCRGATKPAPQLLSSHTSTREPVCRKLQSSCALETACRN